MKDLAIYTLAAAIAAAITMDPASIVIPLYTLLVVAAYEAGLRSARRKKK